VLQPFLQNGGKIAANPGTNGLVVVGDPATREALTGLIRTFDVDTLAGQSYALVPVTSGDAQNTAQALQVAFNTQTGGTLASVVRVVPMQTINSVLVIASNQGYIDDARRVYALIDRVRRQTVRSWHAYYLQNSRSNDVTYVLQQAFTPGHVTAVPSPSGAAAGPYSGRSGLNSGSGSGMGGRGGGGGLGSSGGLGSGGLGSGGGLGSSTGSQAAGGTQAPTGGDSGDQASLAAGNPLLGGLGGAPDQSDSAATANTMRIIQNSANNAVLVYGTAQETETVEAMLRKIDIVPLQVLIDAVIAEVTLTDDLKYGTQFFFKSRGLAVNGNAGDSTISSLVGGNPATGPSGLFVGGAALNGAPAVLAALQAVT
jgi:general secretion pathway protein D